jgi:hypothetical protein
VLVGYACVSTEDQDLRIQRAALTGVGCFSHFRLACCFEQIVW